jgi:hypothetical protein
MNSESMTFNTVRMRAGSAWAEAFQAGSTISHAALDFLRGEAHMCGVKSIIFHKPRNGVSKLLLHQSSPGLR